MARVMLLLGGNQGDMVGTIDRAVELMAERIGEVKSRSKIYVSEAWGFEQETPPFTNQAVIFDTELQPEEVLQVALETEQRVGRRRDVEQQERVSSGERYASRVIDIDVILYDEVVMQSDELTLPHPLMQEREFVLEPICEIAPEWRNPRLGLSCREIYEKLSRV